MNSSIDFFKLNKDVPLLSQMWDAILSNLLLFSHLDADIIVFVVWS